MICLSPPRIPWPMVGDRTTIPRTRPLYSVIRYPSNEKVVVVCTVPCILAPRGGRLLKRLVLKAAAHLGSPSDLPGNRLRCGIRDIEHNSHCRAEAVENLEQYGTIALRNGSTVSARPLAWRKRRRFSAHARGWPAGGRDELGFLLSLPLWLRFAKRVGLFCRISALPRILAFPHNSRSA